MQRTGPCELTDEGLCVWSPGRFPLVVSPAADDKDWSVERLRGWIASHHDWVAVQLAVYGAILFRGFPVHSSGDFEQLSLVLVPDLEGDFFHSTPRSKFNGSSVVHTASDDAPWVVIPAHCERCWIPSPPRAILFFAHTPNEGSGGETPLTDFRQVWRDMDPDVQAAFLAHGLKYRRQFFDETRGLLDAVKTFSWPIPVSWQHMFGTNALPAIESRAKELGFEIQWLDRLPGRGIMEASNRMPAIAEHPQTHHQVWHNHLNLLHVSSPAAEYAFSAQHQSSWLYLLLHYYTRCLVAVNRIMFGERYIGQTTVFGDGSQIPDQIVDHVRGLIWDNTLIRRHQVNDVIIVDNYRLAHSRQPYSGFRRILTSWA